MSIVPFLLLAVLAQPLTFPSASLDTDTCPYVAAHRGCHFEGLVPENSLEAVRMAARFGYPAVECDVKYTSDSVMVIMHDKTINRTMRSAKDYSVIKQKITVADHSYGELATGFVLASSDPALRTSLPTLGEFLDVCVACGITPILHSSIPESYRLAQQKCGDNWICFNSSYEAVATSRAFSNCLILWDPRLELQGPQQSLNHTPGEVVSKLRALGGRTGMSSMKYDLLSETFIKEVRAAGQEVQASIWPYEPEVRACHDGASIILSNLCWFQGEGRTPDKVWQGNRRMDRFETVSAEFSQSEFSAMTLELTFKGSVHVDINGVRSYSFNHAVRDTETIGLRMHDTAASVSITGTGTTGAVKYKAMYYTL